MLNDVFNFVCFDLPLSHEEINTVSVNPTNSKIKRKFIN